VYGQAAYRCIMTVAQRERAALVDTFRSVGPDAPTLCEGWATRDLAAHLVVRERRPDATLGIAIPPLAGYTASVQQRVAESTDWDDLVDMVASGPPIFSPFKLLDPVVNPGEMFVHHEDVRRAGPGWVPRPLDSQTVSALERPLRMIGRLTLAKSPVRVALRTPEGKVLVTAGSGPPVVVTGDVGELLLFAFGRDAVVLDFEGDDDAVAKLKATKRST
jgi:uncharacterized protein (TIGR03085 family)